MKEDKFGGVRIPLPAFNPFKALGWQTFCKGPDGFAGQEVKSNILCEHLHNHLKI